MMGHTDDLSLTGGGGHYRRQTRALTVILVTVIQAGVAMEQCDVRALPHQDIVTSSIRGSLTYTRKLLTVSADFWTEGVGSSKKILKKIINKINKYEENNDKIEKKVNKKIGFRFRRLGGAEVWYDEKENRAMNKDEYCARVDHIKENERIKNQNIKEINYTCTETEQL